MKVNKNYNGPVTMISFIYMDIDSNARTGNHVFESTIEKGLTAADVRDVIIEQNPELKDRCEFVIMGIVPFYDRVQYDRFVKEPEVERLK